MAELFCVIMAGGGGERFWPRSRKETPKQLLNLLGEGSLIEQTVRRLHGFVQDSRIFIITNKRYVDRIRKICPHIPAENIIGEPCAKDTAPCVALAAGIVKAAAETDNPQILFLPADHWITDQNALISDYNECVKCAEKTNSIMTIGIVPTHASTDYGYIECQKPYAENPHIFSVSKFLEKPKREYAEELLKKGNYKWNSGMFIFPLKRLFQEMESSAPDLKELADHISAVWNTEEFARVLSEEFEKIRKISVDYAIMEHAADIMVLEASFVWDDIGNWTALKNHFPGDCSGNVINGSSFLLDCKNCTVFTDDDSQLIAGIDLENMLLIKTKDAVLVLPSESAPKIKALLSEFSKNEKLQKYL